MGRASRRKREARRRRAQPQMFLDCFTSISSAPVESISDVRVNGTPIEDLPEVAMHLRGRKGWHQAMDGDRPVVYYDGREVEQVTSIGFVPIDYSRNPAYVLAADLGTDPDDERVTRMLEYLDEEVEVPERFRGRSPLPLHFDGEDFFARILYARILYEAEICGQLFPDAYAMGAELGNLFLPHTVTDGEIIDASVIEPVAIGTRPVRALLPAYNGTEEDDAPDT